MEKQQLRMVGAINAFRAAKRGSTAEQHARQRWVTLADAAAPMRVQNCKDIVEALCLYQNAPNDSTAKKVYADLVKELQKYRH